MVRPELMEIRGHGPLPSSQWVVSPMVAMSRAIRHVIEDHTPGTGSGIHDLPEDAVREFSQIVGAFAADLRDEVVRRQSL